MHLRPLALALALALPCPPPPAPDAGPPSTKAPWKAQLGVRFGWGQDSILHGQTAGAWCIVCKVPLNAKPYDMERHEFGDVWEKHLTAEERDALDAFDQKRKAKKRSAGLDGAASSSAGAPAAAADSGAPDAAVSQDRVDEIKGLARARALTRGDFSQHQKRANAAATVCAT